MLPFTKLAKFAKDALGVQEGQSIADGYSVADVINMGGRWLAAAHQWAWLSQAVTTLDYVGGQDWVELPADFRSLGTVELSNGLSHRVRVTTMDILARYRTTTITSSVDRWVAIGYRVSPSLGRRAVLEIYPGPGEDAAGVLTLYYSAGWSDIKDGQDVDVPTFMEPLVIEAVRETAMGLAGEGGRGVADRMSVLCQSRYFMDFRRQDGQVQGEYGLPMDTSGSPRSGSVDPPFVASFPNPTSGT